MSLSPLSVPPLSIYPLCPFRSIIKQVRFHFGPVVDQSEMKSHISATSIVRVVVWAIRLAEADREDAAGTNTNSTYVRNRHARIGRVPAVGLYESNNPLARHSHPTGTTGDSRKLSHNAHYTFRANPGVCPQMSRQRNAFPPPIPQNQAKSCSFPVECLIYLKPRSE